MTQQEEAQRNKQQFVDALQALHPDLYRVYQCMETIKMLGGNGKLDIHMVKGNIKRDNGIYIQPGFTDNLVVANVYIKKSTRIIKYDGLA